MGPFLFSSLSLLFRDYRGGTPGEINPSSSASLLGEISRSLTDFVGAILGESSY